MNKIPGSPSLYDIQKLLFVELLISVGDYYQWEWKINTQENQQKQKKKKKNRITTLPHPRLWVKDFLKSKVKLKIE